MSLNYFDQASVSDSTRAYSTLNLGDIVTTIQSAGTDSFFDSTNKIGTVYVFYTHQDGRQQKKLVHDSTAHRAPVSWTPNAIFIKNLKIGLLPCPITGAITFLGRGNIGTGEDLTHSGGITNLNTI